ncbi:TatA/E family twin arginine-targeting protein translocase [Leptolyngbya sp. FACHB-261]|uniref:TatA/E family twin arginine-targeting protein translocase n=1 Tax=Leptolyngbya sp. FACHB-261 TaxID=2692806 RepID=UPI001682E1A5|nr:TatA/E family twin arginine-targeting protein translocase [Leptolyngbya sp. FACHB-261]MBD2104648.1 TatA/E family twin arginine-targeting protein translocase [Leptolyngbya sp. FACHB-261]
MNVFGIGLPEMALIMVVALLIFGPKKLPEIGRSLGKAIRGFQDASKEFENEFKREAAQLESQEVEQPVAAVEPSQAAKVDPVAVVTENTSAAELTSAEPSQNGTGINETVAS